MFKLKKIKITQVGVLLLLFLILGSVPAAFAGEEEYADIAVDLSKDSEYENLFSWKNTTISYANDADYHFFYIKNDDNISNAFFGNEDIEYNITNDLSELAIKSIRNNDSIEFRADRKFGNTVFIEVNTLRYILSVDPIDPLPQEDKKNEPEEQETKNRSITLEYFLIAIIIFSNMGWAFAVLIMKAKDKTIIAAYQIQNKGDGKETLTKEAETIGIVNNEDDPDFDAERGLFIYEISHLGKRFKLYSLLSLQEFKANHRVIKDYLIRHVLDAYTHKVKVKEAEVEVGYSFPTKIARFITHMFKFSAWGVPLAYVTNFVFFLLILDGDFILSLVLAFPIALIFSVILYEIDNRHIFKKKTKKVTEELHLSPAKSRFKVVYIFKVSGSELTKEDLADKTKKGKWKRFEDRIVRGWDKINEMKKSDLVKIKEADIKFVRKERIKRSEHQIEDLRKSYIFRNKHLTELILEQNAEITKKTSRIRELEKEKQLAKEEVRQENAETLKEIDMAQDLKWSGIKQYFIDKFGDIAETNFASEMKRLVEAQAKAQGKDIKTDIDSIKEILIELYKNRNQPNSKLDLTIQKLKEFDQKAKGEKASG
ncbi:MAG: hypothetical protein KGY74_09825 [Candidatus Cloacimonetes bacterium]|nr:hypothetical protein [Candidatus Cloacimonadota bacterium]